MCSTPRCRRRRARPAEIPARVQSRRCRSAGAARRWRPARPPGAARPGRRDRADRPAVPPAAAARRCRSAGRRCRPPPAPAGDARGLEQRVGQPARGWPAAAARVRSAKSAGLQLQHHAAGGEVCLRQPPRQLLRQPPQVDAPARRCALRSCSNVVSALIDFVSRVGSTVRASSPRARRASAGPSSPSRRCAARSPSACRSASRVMPMRREPCAPAPGRRRAAAAPARARAVRRPRRPITAEAARLVASGGDLCQQAVRRQADRDGDADLRSTSQREAGQHGGGRRAVQRLGAGEVEHRLVDRQRLHQRRQSRPSARGSGAMPPCTWRNRVGSPPRPGRAFSALNIGMALRTPWMPRDVAGGRHHAARAGAADDHRAGRQLRPVALLHAGEEGVAVDVGDGERKRLRVADQTPAAADRAGGRVAWHRETVAAEARGGVARRWGHLTCTLHTAMRGPRIMPWCGYE